MAPRSRTRPATRPERGSARGDVAGSGSPAVAARGPVQGPDLPPDRAPHPRVRSTRGDRAPCRAIPRGRRRVAALRRARRGDDLERVGARDRRRRTTGGRPALALHLRGRPVGPRPAGPGDAGGAQRHARRPRRALVARPPERGVPPGDGCGGRVRRRRADRALCRPAGRLVHRRAARGMGPPRPRRTGPGRRRCRWTASLPLLPAPDAGSP